MIFSPITMLTNAGIVVFLAGCSAEVRVEQALSDFARDSIEQAEAFITANGYDIERPCPDELLRRESEGLYDMQPPCQHYRASESSAFAVADFDDLAQVFFRKVPPTKDGEHESFRVVEVTSDEFEFGERTYLKDIELYLPGTATILQ